MNRWVNDIREGEKERDCSWQVFVTLGGQNGLVVIISCWESNLDSLSLCVQACVHAAHLILCLQLVFMGVYLVSELL